MAQHIASQNAPADAGQTKDTAGARLLASRQALGLTAEQCAEKLGVSAARWHEFEADIRPLDFITGMDASELLGVDPYWLAKRRKKS